MRTILSQTAREKPFDNFFRHLTPWSNQFRCYYDAVSWSGFSLLYPRNIIVSRVVTKLLHFQNHPDSMKVDEDDGSRKFYFVDLIVLVVNITEKSIFFPYMATHIYKLLQFSIVCS